MKTIRTIAIDAGGQAAGTQVSAVRLTMIVNAVLDELDRLGLLTRGADEVIRDVGYGEEL